MTKKPPEESTIEHFKHGVENSQKKKSEKKQLIENRYVHEPLNDSNLSAKIAMARNLETKGFSKASIKRILHLNDRQLRNLNQMGTPSSKEDPNDQ